MPPSVWTYVCLYVFPGREGVVLLPSILWHEEIDEACRIAGRKRNGQANLGFLLLSGRRDWLWNKVLIKIITNPSFSRILKRMASKIYLFVCLSVCLDICLSVHLLVLFLSRHPSVCLCTVILFVSVCLSVCYSAVYLFFCTSVSIPRPCVSVNLFVSPGVRLFFCPSNWMFVYQGMRVLLSVSLSVRLIICLSV